MPLWVWSVGWYNYIGVGFGVARSTIRAMRQPPVVGRVTRSPTLFVVYGNGATIILQCAHYGRGGHKKQISMAISKGRPDWQVEIEDTIDFIKSYVSNTHFLIDKDYVNREKMAHETALEVGGNDSEIVWSVYDSLYDAYEVNGKEDVLAIMNSSAVLALQAYYETTLKRFLLELNINVSKERKKSNVSTYIDRIKACLQIEKFGDEIERAIQHLLSFNKDKNHVGHDCFILKPAKYSIPDLLGFLNEIKTVLLGISNQIHLK